jgi:hypothetical protein
VPTKIRRLVTLDPWDCDLIKHVQLEYGFGERGFSAALRFILRDWESSKMRYAAFDRFLFEIGIPNHNPQPEPSTTSPPGDL